MFHLATVQCYHATMYDVVIRHQFMTYLFSFMAIIPCSPCLYIYIMIYILCMQKVITADTLLTFFISFKFLYYAIRKLAIGNKCP